MPEQPSRLPAPRTLAVIAGVLVLLLTPWWVMRQQRLKAEHLAEPIAKRLTNRDIDVHCPGMFGRILYETNEGRVRFDADGVPENRTDLSKRTCAGLRTVADDGATLDFSCLTAASCDEGTRQAAETLAVLTHEIFHLRGATDEGQTECQARGRVQDVAVQADVQPQQAAALAVWMAGPWQAQLPERYRNASC